MAPLSALESNGPRTGHGGTRRREQPVEKATGECGTIDLSSLPRGTHFVPFALQPRQMSDLLFPPSEKVLKSSINVRF